MDETVNTVVTYDRPIKAKLYVHLDNGEMWEAKASDLEKFELIRRLDAYMIFERALLKILIDGGVLDDDENDITDAALNPIRYLVETSIMMPELLSHPEHAGWLEVLAIEHALRQHARCVTEKMTA